MVVVGVIVVVVVVVAVARSLLVVGGCMFDSDDKTVDKGICRIGGLAAR